MILYSIFFSCYIPFPGKRSYRSSVSPFVLAPLDVLYIYCSSVKTHGRRKSVRMEKKRFFRDIDNINLWKLLSFIQISKSATVPMWLWDSVGEEGSNFYQLILNSFTTAVQLLGGLHQWVSIIHKI